MKGNVDNYRSRAYDCLRQVRILMNDDEYTGICNRAYYAYFDSIRALLAILAIATRSHAAVQNLFSVHFVQEGLFTREGIRVLSKLFAMRQESDYDADPSVDEVDARYALTVTTEFLLQVEVYLTQNGFTS